MAYSLWLVTVTMQQLCICLKAQMSPFLSGLFLNVSACSLIRVINPRNWIILLKRIFQQALEMAQFVHPCTILCLPFWQNQICVILGCKNSFSCDGSAVLDSSIILPVNSSSHSLCRPLSPFPVTPWCVCQCCSVAGVGGPRDFDWAQLNSVRVTGDMWFTAVILAMVASNHTQKHTYACNHGHWCTCMKDSTCIHVYNVGSKHKTQMETH